MAQIIGKIVRSKYPPENTKVLWLDTKDDLLKAFTSSGWTKVYANTEINALRNAGYLFAGIATIDTNPEIPDAKIFYIANGKGKYTNFGGINVTEDNVVILYYDNAWHKVATGIASQAKLSELESKTDQQFSQLKQLINGGYLFKGIVTPSSDVITTDNKIFVVASEVGTYTNFGGYVVTKGELAFLYYDTEWHKGSVEVAVEEEEILATDEDGFAIVDNQLQVGMKYDKNGFDIAKIADHAKEMLESRLYNGAFASVNEDGLFVVDENLNIGVKVDNAGVHALNILEYEIINE